MKFGTASLRKDHEALASCVSLVFGAGLRIDLICVYCTGVHGAGPFLSHLEMAYAVRTSACCKLGPSMDDVIPTDLDRLESLWLEGRM